MFFLDDAMGQKSRFRQQRLRRIGLMPQYVPELPSLELLGLTDRAGNSLALYQLDYLKLQKFLENQSIGTKDFASFSAPEKLRILDAAQVKVIRYIAPKNLAGCELDARLSSFTSDIYNKDESALPKEGHQNCVVMRDGHIYIHPKIRSVPGNISHEVIPHAEVSGGRVGVSHSSLRRDGPVQFAGSFVHDAKSGWRIENSTGHYATQPFQLRNFLIKLKDQGMDLNQLTVRMMVSKKGKASHTDSNDDFIVIDENAHAFLERVSSSLEATSKMLVDSSTAVEMLKVGVAPNPIDQTTTNMPKK
jgi:hypothetical protein